MGAWKAILVAIVAVDIEFADAIHTLELLEAIERNFARSGDELEQLGTLLLVE